MKQNLLFGDNEIVFGSADTAKSQAIRRAVLAKRLRKLLPRVYTSNLEDASEVIVRRNLYHILGELFPGAILSHRTALEGGPAENNSIILTYKYNKKVELPGMTVRLMKGLGAQAGDTPFMQNLFISSRPRALLENLQPSRGKFAKTLPRVAIEDYLDRLCSVHGMEEVNRLRDQARQLAPVLGLSHEFQLLDKLIGAILSTQSDVKLRSQSAKARATGKPYDVGRLELFAGLNAKLIATVLPISSQPELSSESLQNLAFFEAYFSNYIEGTEFEVDEAADIVFRNKVVPSRPEDAHDVMSTYQIVSNTHAMKQVPSSPEQLVQLLKKRHQTLMAVRKDKHPGEFKERANRAGNTTFVEPELVVGTLEQAFKLYQALQTGLQRAIFMMFVISEVHPFDDGNGRIARIMMNAELVSAAQNRIIIPTVYREDYLLTLRRLSRAGDAEPYIKMLTRAQAFTASLNFSSYSEALSQLRQANAFMQPFEGKLVFD